MQNIIDDVFKPTVMLLYEYVINYLVTNNFLEGTYQEKYQDDEYPVDACEVSNLIEFVSNEMYDTYGDVKNDQFDKEFYEGYDQIEIMNRLDNIYRFIQGHYCYRLFPEFSLMVNNLGLIDKQFLDRSNRVLKYTNKSKPSILHYINSPMINLKLVSTEPIRFNNIAFLKYRYRAEYIDGARTGVFHNEMSNYGKSVRTEGYVSLLASVDGKQVYFGLEDIVVLVGD